jgi:hypothetical protein
MILANGHEPGIGFEFGEKIDKLGVIRIIGRVKNLVCRYP